MSLLYDCSEVGNPRSTHCREILFYIFLYKTTLKRRERRRRRGIGLFYMLSVYLCTTAAHVESRVKRDKCKENERGVVKSKGSKGIKTVLRQQTAWRHGETKAVDTPPFSRLYASNGAIVTKRPLFLFYVHRKQARAETAFSSNEQFK
jgi:hypothetical protein